MKNYKNIEQCVILMAGKGTRFLPATKVMAKEMFPIENKPALLYHLNECYKSGINRICIVISKEKEYVKDFMKHDKELEYQLEMTGKSSLLENLNEIIDNMDITFVYQGELNGSGGAVYATKEWTNGKPFGLIFGDDLCKESDGKLPTIGQMAEIYQNTEKMVVGAKRFPLDVIPNYSSIVTGKQVSENCCEMKSIIEKPKKDNIPSNLVGLARYILIPEIFDEIINCPKFTLGEIRLTDAICKLAEKGKAVCFEFDAKYYDCGNKLEYIKCILDFGLEDLEIKEKLKEHLKSLI